MGLVRCQNGSITSTAPVRTRPENIREPLKTFYQKTVELCEIL